MSLTSRSSQQPLVFDDEPIDSILYGPSSRGPSPATVFTDIDPVVDEIKQAAGSNNIARALEVMGWLFAGQSPVPLSACMSLVRVLRSMVPLVPKPILTDTAIKAGPLLHEIIARAKRVNATDLQTEAETIVYRWHEGRGEYGKARSVVASLRDRAASAGDDSQLAVMINNYAYEFLLEGNYLDAEPHFINALKSFKDLGMKTEVPNALANLLTCRFALSPNHEWEAMLPELAESHCALRDAGDWRVRKTSLLYSERAIAQGRLTVAVAWARKAETASRKVTTQLHQDDENYLRSLKARRDQ